MSEQTASRSDNGMRARYQALLDSDDASAVECVGALTVVDGHCHGQLLHLALTDRSVAGGSLGVEESDVLAATFARSREDRTPVVLALDSAGARLNSGLAGLAAFRRMYRAALELRLADVPMVALLERDCFGGASMLAMLCTARGALRSTRIGMSGPAIIEALAGKQDLDTSDREAVRALFGAAARARTGAIDEVFDEQASRRDVLAGLLRLAGDRHVDIHDQHARLQQRLHDTGAAMPAMSAADASDLFCRGTPVGAYEIWQLANAILAAKSGGAVTLRINCPGQAASRRDELLVLSEYVAHLALCISERCTGGVEIVTRIEGECSGGIYVALAAGVARVEATPNAILRVLPAKAVEVVLGKMTSEETLGDALATGVVDHVITPNEGRAGTHVSASAPGNIDEQ